MTVKMSKMDEARWRERMGRLSEDAPAWWRQQQERQVARRRRRARLVRVLKVVGMMVLAWVCVVALWVMGR